MEAAVKVCTLRRRVERGQTDYIRDISILYLSDHGIFASHKQERKFMHAFPFDTPFRKPQEIFRLSFVVVILG
jgi:hypothetical protein